MLLIVLFNISVSAYISYYAFSIYIYIVSIWTGHDAEVIHQRFCCQFSKARSLARNSPTKKRHATTNQASSSTLLQTKLLLLNFDF